MAAHAVEAHVELRPEPPPLKFVQGFLVYQKPVGHDGDDQDIGVDQRIHDGEEIPPQERLAARQGNGADARRLHLPDDVEAIGERRLVYLSGWRAQKRRFLRLRPH